MPIVLALVATVGCATCAESEVMPNDTKAHARTPIITSRRWTAGLLGKKFCKVEVSKNSGRDLRYVPYRLARVVRFIFALGQIRQTGSSGGNRPAGSDAVRERRIDGEDAP
jgi:hypothetical protein